MLKLTFANHYETLRDELLSAVADGPASPFAAEQIIIPSVALRRDLTLSMATRHGVCANVEFAYLAQWLWRQIGKVVPGIDSESPFAAPVLTWRIFQILSDPRFASGFPRLTNYLKAVDAVARLDFATRVASLFEQYMTYRPEWLADWAAGKSVSIKGETADVAEDQAWQAALWRMITSQLGTEREHPASRFLKTVEKTAGATDRFGLPEAAHVFCLPAMPPLYIDILQQLGRWIDLRVYVLNPCREFWFDIVDRRRLGYMNVRGEADYHETGNPLLADWGQQTKAHIELVLERSGDAPVDDGGFAEQTSDTLLARLQNTVLNLVDIAPGSLVTKPGDRSIEIHVCHSLTRELEVLQDQLLALLAGINSSNPLTPADILVVTPDLEAAGPLIEAVFGNAPPGRYIPFTLTGRARSTINEPARAFLQLLTVATSRFTASDVFDLLQQPILARRFGIEADDLDLVRDWITSSGIRWALDGQSSRPVRRARRRSLQFRRRAAAAVSGLCLAQRSLGRLAGSRPRRRGGGRGGHAPRPLCAFRRRTGTPATRHAAAKGRRGVENHCCSTRSTTSWPPTRTTSTISPKYGMPFASSTATWHAWRHHGEPDARRGSHRA
jgi:exodeoxyribonuclease V gamma subunit